MAANAQQRSVFNYDARRVYRFCGRNLRRGGIGIVVAIIGAVLLLVSVAGFHKIKTI